MIRLSESGRRRDGTKWRARSGRAVLRAGEIYHGLGRDHVPGYLFIEDGEWARCMHESEMETVSGDELPVTGEGALE